jgi:glycosyltransferase involved in cell wall biosynthesis
MGLIFMDGCLAIIHALERAGNINVIGHVDDIRPYLKHAIISIAPMQVASGFKNKIIEAIAMNLPVLATTVAVSDQSFSKEVNLQTADNPEQQADIILGILNSEERISNHRLYVKNNHSWEQVLGALIQHFN